MRGVQRGDLHSAAYGLPVVKEDRTMKLRRNTVQRMARGRKAERCHAGNGDQSGESQLTGNSNALSVGLALDETKQNRTDISPSCMYDGEHEHRAPKQESPRNTGPECEDSGSDERKRPFSKALDFRFPTDDLEHHKNRTSPRMWKDMGSTISSGHRIVKTKGFEKTMRS